jgi:hypothetical protein
VISSSLALDRLVADLPSFVERGNVEARWVDEFVRSEERVYLQAVGEVLRAGAVTAVFEVVEIYAVDAAEAGEGR